MLEFSKPPYDFKKGTLLLVDKPLDWTSFDVVNKIRYALKQKLNIKKIKVGHAGTLDPRATGLLLICTGKFTKKLTELQGKSKTYTGTLKLGESTPSYDGETEPDETFPTSHITEELLEEARKTFLGDIDQFPPMFSAIKVDGKRLYKSARMGVKVELKSRPVHIFQFDTPAIRLPEVDFIVTCSKGTYIRSLAHDYGKAVRSGGYLTALRRTAIGDYQLKDAWNLEELIEHIQNCEVPVEED